MCNVTFGWQISLHANIMVSCPQQSSLSYVVSVFCICPMIDHTNWYVTDDDGVMAPDLHSVLLELCCILNFGTETRTSTEIIIMCRVVFIIRWV